MEIAMERMSIPIGGMSCGGCVNNVRNALARLPGVQVDQVKVGSATLAYDPALVTPEAIREAVTRAGYQPLAA
jgi:copper chaperone CopZ